MHKRASGPTILQLPFESLWQAIGPGGLLYLPVSISLIAFFNYYYTFLQVGMMWQQLK